MRPVPAAAGNPADRLILGVSGVLLLAAGGLAARLAALHMAALGVICGASPATPHCGWCVTAAALMLAGAAATYAALRPARRLAPARRTGPSGRP
jgi:hypothetical protein